MARRRSILLGLRGAARGAMPWVHRAIMQEELAKQQEQKAISDYYRDLLATGELEVTPPTPIGPMAGPVPVAEETGLAGYLRPEAPAPRAPTVEEEFDVMRAISRGRRLPPGVRIKPPKIPKGLEPAQFTHKGITYSRPTKEVKKRTDPRFEEMMDVAGKHWASYKEAIDNDDELGIELYSKRFESAMDVAEGLWTASNPDIPFDRFELAELAKDQSGWQKFWGLEPKGKKVAVVEKGKKYAVGDEVTTKRGTFKYLGNDRWQKTK